MKPIIRVHFAVKFYPAAFRRLCVETTKYYLVKLIAIPAAFRRLCVETPYMTKGGKMEDPAAFRRLCVETFLLFWNTQRA